MFSVWMIPVFAYCIWVGKHFSKRCKGCFWGTFLFFPTAFMLTALFSLLLQNHSSPCCIVYLMSLWIGGILGLLITNQVAIKIDLVRQTIATPGSWLLFVCLMVLCVSKCVFDVLKVSMPADVLQLTLVSFAIKGTVTGLLYGQAVSFCYRFAVASKCDPREIVRGRFVSFYGMKPLSQPKDASCLLSSAA